HTGEQPSKCLECSKSFRNSSSLITHQCLHTREKLYKCPKYGKRKSCNHSSCLVRHQCIHMAERPYKCPECEKSF
ncbi:ZSC20 protein, partial [Furnarius figulus]|nr:ZSC20 protein [Furnarius figulus]